MYELVVMSCCLQSCNTVRTSLWYLRHTAVALWHGLVLRAALSTGGPLTVALKRCFFQFLYRFCSYIDIAASSVLVVLITLNFIYCQITDILIFTNFSDQFIKVINFRVL